MVTFLSNERVEVLDELLDGVCRKLQITPTMHKDAEAKYNAIGKWLAEEGSELAVFDPAIYPQGSIRLGTTVKPIDRNEFDVDCICQFNKMRCDMYPPQTVYDLVEKRLKENEIYASRIERFKRCLRINYAGDFHLDITPACPDLFRRDGSIFVTDRKMQEWKSSNPKGYAEWFEEKCLLYIRKMAEAQAEPIPSQEDSDYKAPLKRAVQLFKRYQDIKFSHQEESPRSIVLTTLAGNFYRGEPSTFEALFAIVDRIADYNRRGGMITVLNPVNEQENFSESWDAHPKEYADFCDFVRKFAESLEELSETQGIHNIKRIMEQLFGETVTQEVIKEYSDSISKGRETGSLGITGLFSVLTLSECSAKVPQNNFYGD